jgi:hypothetical protein
MNDLTDDQIRQLHASLGSERIAALTRFIDLAWNHLYTVAENSDEHFQGIDDLGTLEEFALDEVIKDLA